MNILRFKACRTFWSAQVLKPDVNNAEDFVVQVALLAGLCKTRFNSTWLYIVIYQACVLLQRSRSFYRYISLLCDLIPSLDNAGNSVHKMTCLYGVKSLNTANFKMFNPHVKENKTRFPVVDLPLYVRRSLIVWSVQSIRLLVVLLNTTFTSRMFYAKRKMTRNTEAVAF